MQNSRNLIDVIIVKTLIYVRILPRPVTGTMEEDGEHLSSMGMGWQEVEINEGLKQMA